MSINVASPIFKFASIRNSKEVALPTDEISIMPNTDLTNSIVEINVSDSPSEQKLIELNVLLQDFIDSSDFIKSKVDVSEVVNSQLDGVDKIKQLYNNVIVRLITKSNTNTVFGLLIKEIKNIATELHATVIEKIKVIIPEKITITIPLHSNDSEHQQSSVNDYSELMGEIASYTDAKVKLEEANANKVVFLENSSVQVINLDHLPLVYFNGNEGSSLTSITQLVDSRLSFLNTQIRAKHNFPQTDAELSGETTIEEIRLNNLAMLNEELGSIRILKNLSIKLTQQGVTTISKTFSKSTEFYNSILVLLDIDSISVQDAELIIDKKLKELHKHFDKLIPTKTYSLIGKEWKDVTSVLKTGVVSEDESGTSIIVNVDGCQLKYPVKVADLRIVEQQSVGYLPAEIAHINNAQKGEKNERVTRRLKTVESFESFIEESEITQETDTQSTERFGIENQSFQVQQEENSWNVNATVSGSYGPVSATVNGGYASSSMVTSGNSSSMNYAKDIFTRVIDRISNRVRSERSVKTIEEFEETVTHFIDNSDQETKSYVYRWLNKLVRGTLKNYGKRVIFEIPVAHPSSYYLSRIIRDTPQLQLPEDPRDLQIGGVTFGPNMINYDNYVALSTIYKTQIDAPPIKNLIISEVFNGKEDFIYEGKLVPIKKGYACKKAVLTNSYGLGWPGGHHMVFMVGVACYAHWEGQDDFWAPRTLWLANETEQIPVSIRQGRAGYIFNLEIHCELTPAALNDWQTEAYFNILESYDRLKSQVDSRVNDFDPNAPGLSPEKKLDLIKTELKKEAIRKMYRCNPFWVNDGFKVGHEYNPDCCADSINSESVDFLESVFDWRNMTYVLHPYFYNNKSQWSKLLDLEDNDPHFEAFLKASFATVHIPVHRDKLKEIAACNFLINNSVGNFETIPEGLEQLLSDVSVGEASEFTVGLDGQELPVPSTTVDLGIFPVPTSLVILECGNEDGVKPIGFPQTDAVDPGVVIPKQYSPAIISDSCNNS